MFSQLACLNKPPVGNFLIERGLTMLCARVWKVMKSYEKSIFIIAPGKILPHTNP